MTKKFKDATKMKMTPNEDTPKNLIMEARI